MKYVVCVGDPWHYRHTPAVWPRARAFAGYLRRRHPELDIWLEKAS